MYNYLYQITNLINNKIYVGVHKTNNIDDGYMGSGRVIVSSIKKHGVRNFKKEILEFFDTYELALIREAEIVTDEFLLREDVYNLRRGGTGGFDYINKSLSKDKRTEISRMGAKGRAEKVSKEDIISYARKGALISLTSEAQKAQYANGRTNGFSDKHHTEETKVKIGNYTKISQAGTRNSQYGIKRAWVNKDGKLRKVKLEELDQYIMSGWLRGVL